MIIKYYLKATTFFRLISKRRCNFSAVFATVKSDRINALRKQYDAFLEEDKRRKERNEYILGRLDKMRYCTAMVPLRNKPAVFIDRRDNFTPSSSLMQLNKSSLDIQRQFDETGLLQEIRKKYILIPKIRPSIEADNISNSTFKPTFEESVDWKSKYEILDQLKRKEKEDASSLSPEHSQNSNYDNIQERDIQNYNTKTFDDNVGTTKLANKYEELPEKDTEGTKCAEVPNYYKAKIEPETYPLSNDQVEAEHLLKEEPQINTCLNNSAPQNEIEFNNNSENLEPYLYTQGQTEPTPTFYPEAAPKDENIDHGTQNYPVGKHNEEIIDPSVNKQYSPIEENKDIDDTEKYYPEDAHAIEVIRPDDLVKQINNADLNVAPENIETKENYQYPIQTINVQDFTPGNEVPLQDGVNINPEGYPAELSNAYALDTVTSTYNYNSSSEVAEHIENTEDTSGIEAFDAEQREMFYSEGTNENYGYNQENIEGYEQELPVPGVDYSQGETAVYYEGYDAEQAYPVEIGEHEEANQRYDPHYEQQYATNYAQQEYSQEGYEQQVYTQDPQNEGEGDVNRVQEGLEQFQFEQQHEYETVENIEQQLDAEQGYNEQIILSNIEKPIEDLQEKAPKPEQSSTPNT